MPVGADPPARTSTRDRLPAVGLAVTHTNPAMGLYAALGFDDVLDALNVEV